MMPLLSLAIKSPVKLSIAVKIIVLSIFFNILELASYVEAWCFHQLYNGLGVGHPQPRREGLGRVDTSSLSKAITVNVMALSSEMVVGRAIPEGITIAISRGTSLTEMRVQWNMYISKGQLLIDLFILMSTDKL